MVQVLKHHIFCIKSSDCKGFVTLAFPSSVFQTGFSVIFFAYYVSFDIYGDQKICLGQIFGICEKYEVN